MSLSFTETLCLICFFFSVTLISLKEYQGRRTFLKKKSQNQVEGSSLADIQSTTYFKLCSLYTYSLLQHSETEKLQYSIDHYQQYTSEMSSKLNFSSSMGHKFAVMTELQSQSLCFYAINVSFYRFMVVVHNFMLILKNV